jgi:hypothetical protein
VRQSPPHGAGSAPRPRAACDHDVARRRRALTVGLSCPGIHDIHAGGLQRAREIRPTVKSAGCLWTVYWLHVELAPDDAMPVRIGALNEPLMPPGCRR